MDGEISPGDVEAALGEAGLRVVDIRSRAAFDRGHIPGSVNVPMPELPTRVEELGVEGADRIVTVCPHGKASVQAARLLASYEGTDAPVESMAGGLEAWTGPLESAAADGGDEGEDANDDDEGPDAPF